MSKSNSVKFTLFNLSAKPKAYYVVDQEIPDTTSSKKQQTASHHCLIVDRSGSMYGDIDSLRDMLLKLLTVSEYAEAGQLVSLISYSSHGDCTLHFDHVPVKDVMQSNSAHQKAIRNIRSTGATCMSQAITMAKGLLRPNEITGITLHSDGYVNDYSPSSEYAEIEKTIQSFKESNVFINTIAYRSNSDFKFLSKIANSVSGSCLMASSVKELFDAFCTTADALSGKNIPAMVFDAKGYNYQVFVSKALGRVNGSSGELKITGLSQGNDAILYRYKEVTKSEYDASSAAETQTHNSVLALSKGLLAEGNLNRAKYALFSSCRPLLTKAHVRAITSEQIAAMSKELELHLFETPATMFEVAPPKSLGDGITALKLISILEKHLGKIKVNVTDLSKSYARRGVKRIDGERDENGKVTTPWLKTEYVDNSDFANIASFDINRTAPSIQLKVVRDSKLVKVADGSQITNVAGVQIPPIKSFNNYTIVGDGTLTIPRLILRVSDPAAVAEIATTGIAKTDQNGDLILDLSQIPVTSYDLTGDISGLNATYEKVLRAKVLSKIMSALTKTESTQYTSEQLAELKKHYLTASMNVSMPSINEYTDIKQALADGIIDTRVAYNVEIGNTDILSADQLESANKFLAKMYEAFNPATGEAIEDDPNMSMYGKGVSFRHKKLSAKTKITKAVTLQKGIYDDFLGLVNSGEATTILKEAGFKGTINDLKAGGLASYESAAKMLEDYVDSLYRNEIIPLTFYVGSVGVLPDGIEAKAETADDIQKRYPDLKIGKDEKTATFFQLGNALLMVYTTSEYFSTGKKVDAKSAAPVTA